MRRRGPSRRGFTLLEALLAIATLALMATAIATLYNSGIRASDVSTEESQLNSSLRSRMEVLVSKPFGILSNGTETVTTRVSNGQTNAYTMSWEAVPVDLDGDSNPEPDAKQVTVSVEGRSLTIIVVDHAGKVGKL